MRADQAANSTAVGVMYYLRRRAASRASRSIFVRSRSIAPPRSYTALHSTQWVPEVKPTGKSMARSFPSTTNSTRAGIGANDVAGSARVHPVQIRG